MKRALLLSTALLAALALPASAQFSIDPVALPEAIIGAPYPAVEITTTGGTGPIQWSFILAPSPPSGFVIGPRAAGSSVTSANFCYGLIDFATGRPVCMGNVSGFPGSYLINVRAQDSGGQVATRVFALQLVQGLTIVTQSLPEAVINQPYNATLQGAGGTGSYIWTLESGALPSGLVLNSSNGAITGTAPNLATQGSFAIRMTDTFTTASVVRVFTIDVLGGLRITSAALPLAVAGQELQPFQMTAAGGTNLTWSITPGWELPPNFAISPGGLLTGGSGTAGAYTTSIRVRDNDSGLMHDRQYDLFVTLGPLSIVENQLPLAAVNVSYNAQLTVAGGLPPYQWSFATLAHQGLVIDAQTGRISGLPTQLGTFSLPISVIDRTGARFTRLFSLQVVNTVVISTSSLPNGTVGTPYAATLIADGGQAPYRWSVPSGGLPPGLSVDPIQGTINGTPTQNGVYQFTLQVVDAGARTAIRQVGIIVGDGLSIVTTALPDGIVGESYAVALQSSGGLAPVTWTLVSGVLPTGLAFNTSTGVLSGQPSAPFNGSLTFRATDAGNNSAERTFSLNIGGALTITTGAVAGGTRNSPYSFTLTSSGGRAPYSWSISGGSLPPGLQLTTATGVISGTPTASGSYPFTVELRDAGGQLTRVDFTLAIAEPLSITTSAINGTAAQVLSQVLQATGGAPPYTFSLTGGSLPAGLSFNAGSISGTPTQAGTFNVTFQVRDQAQVTATRSIAITIGLPPLPEVIITGLTSSAPGSQVPFGVRLGSTFPVDLQGRAVLTFTPASGLGDDTIRFANGRRDIAFTIPAGSTDAQFSDPAVVLVGTVEGSFTVAVNEVKAGTVDVTPSPAPSRTNSIAATAPVVSSTSLQRSGNTITVVVTGYVTRRAVTDGVFRFSAGSGSSLQQSEFTVNLAAAFAAWFSNPASQATGGQFRLTVPFTVSANAENVNLESVTLR